MSDQSTAAAASQSAWRVGDVVDGLYEVRAVISSGGMGLVYRVHHRGWHIDLAVKTPRPELVSSPLRIADFETEAETWVGLGLHPHVAACVYVRRLGGVPRVFAEWVDGGDLHEAITSGRLYEGSGENVLARILDVAIQFAWGLDYAHGRGLIHQDVKPANVMLTGDWTAKVTDFGLAKARAVVGETTATATGASVLAGFGGMTMAYCSPEQAQAAHITRTGGRPEPLSRATDVWSWAISVWEMFAGEPPCSRGQAAAEAFASFRDDSWVDDPVVPPMPGALAQLLARCLDPDPAARPRRMGELADELAELYQRLVGVPYPRNKPLRAKLLADGLNNQALSMLDLGHIDEAERLWSEALAVDPQHLCTVYNRGLRRWRTAQVTDKQLVAEIESYRASHPTDPDADRLLGYLHLERGDISAACALLDSAAVRAPDDAETATALVAARREPEPAPVRVLAGHDNVRTVAVSADGRLALSGGGSGGENTVWLWDLATGQCVNTLSGHNDLIDSVAISADGHIGLSGSWDETARVWDLAAGRCLKTLTGHAKAVLSVALSPDGRVALTGSHDGKVRVWEVATGRCLKTLTGHTDEVDSVALSADGHIALTGSRDTTARIWDVATGRCLHTLTGHQFENIERPSVALSADGQIALTRADYSTMRVWDVGTGRCVRALTGYKSQIESVAIDADGYLAISTGGINGYALQMWEVATGRCLRTLSGRASLVAIDAEASVAVTWYYKKLQMWRLARHRTQSAPWRYARPASTREFTSSAASFGAAVQRADRFTATGQWSAAALELRAARSMPGYQRHPELLERWRRVTTHGRRSSSLSAVWQLHTLLVPTERAPSVAVCADGRRALTGSDDGQVRVWDAADGTCLHALRDNVISRPAVAVSADGRVGISGGQGGYLAVWDLDSGHCLHRLEDAYGTEWLSELAITADGKAAVSGGDTAHVCLWDLTSGRCLWTFTSSGRLCCISADGRVALSGAGGPLLVWDTASGACLHSLTGHTAEVTAAALSADGHLAVSGSRDRTARVWDPAAGHCLRTLSGHTGSVDSVALSADGRVALTGSSDGTARVWDVATGECVQTLVGVNVAVSADAAVALTGCDDGTARVWMLDWDYEFGLVATTTGRSHPHGVEMTDVTQVPLARDEDSGVAKLPEAGGYELVKKLGHGGKGVVYLGRHQDSGRVVAVKVMLPQVAPNPRVPEIFERQVALLSALHHPNVVALREAGTAGGAVFLALEYCAGGSVQDLIVRGGPLPPDRALAIALQALDGLHYVHTVPLSNGSVGMVHRDIGPSNILLARSGRDLVAKLAGFGLVRALDDSGLPGLPMRGDDDERGVTGGTLSFMARRQLLSFRDVKPEADVWAMAATLYFMLTGRPPRQFDRDVDPVMVVLEDDCVPIRERDSHIPKWLAEVIDAALIDKPCIAITSAADLAAALRSARNGWTVVSG